MAQLDVYLNPDEATKRDVPFILDVQHSLHLQLRTRIVIPLVRTSAQSAILATLCPTFLIDGQSVFASVPELTSFPVQELGMPIINLEDRRSELFAAIDFLLNGF
ncbi:CcdB family protein [Geomesophilobacter sediminis]|uniref:Toxin CcdB n=1 Tax=Geomesophilobacter sediminis TaxID=2798584 RepID=A0A8J7IRS3_9BACT|nr:CcdB family protein [Geomesophilobacter sediminis]MBJ6725749.1 CcdB family protein [Geomesophilobacter sediminis]